MPTTRSLHYNSYQQIIRKSFVPSGEYKYKIQNPVGEQYRLAVSIYKDKKSEKRKWEKKKPERQRARSVLAEWEEKKYRGSQAS